MKSKALLRYTIWVISVFCLILYAVFLKTATKGIYVGESHTVYELINIHESPRRFISINGNKHYGVMGGRAFWLDLPKTSRIFFVAKEVDKVNYFISDKNGGGIVKFSTGDTNELTLAMGIGAQNEIPKTSVEREGINEIVLKNIDANGTHYYAFNLNEKAVSIL